jgi:multidrug resistance efflux pump
MRCALVASALALVGCAGAAAQAEDWGPVRRDDLVLGVDVSGTLRAVKTDFLGPPAIPDLWDFKVSFMAPEGAEVKQGDPVLGFDLSVLQRRLEEKQTERDSVRKQVEKKLADVELARRDETLKIAQAEATLRKAQLKVDRPTDLTGSVELEQARLDLQLAEKDLAYQKLRAQEARRFDAAELGGLRELYRRAEERIGEIQQYIARMTVAAPRAGAVIYVANRMGMKKKVGDSAWRAEKVLETAELALMTARGEVDEVDSSRVAVGQRVTLRLDAHPDAELVGRVSSIARIVQRQSPQNPLRVVQLEIALDKTDPQRMRPGMRFRGTVETGCHKGAVVAPAEAIFVTTAGPIVYRRTATGFAATPVTVGQRNRSLIEVLSGLSPGDRVSRVDLAGAPERGGGGRPRS